MKRDTLALDLSREGFHSLSVAVDTKRARVRVERALLDKLLTDHGRVIRRLHDCGVETRDAEEVKPDEFAATL